MTTTLVPAPKADPDARLIAQHEAALRAISIHDGPLIPQEDLAPLRSALVSRMQPALAKERAGFLVLISSAWPYAHQRTDETTLDGFIQQLEEDISEFPAHVLSRVAVQLRRSQRFAPSISEIYQAGADLLAEIRHAIYVVDSHHAEHERRAAAARKAAERAEEDRRKTQAAIDRLAAKFGSRFQRCTVADYDGANTAMMFAGFRMLEHWMDATEGTEPWVIEALPAAALAHRVFVLLKRNMVTSPEASQLISIIRTDRARAAILVNAIEAGDRANDWASADDTIMWGHPARVFEDLIKDIQRQHEKAIAA